MDSLLIRPKDEEELKYLMELLQNIGAIYKTISEEATEEFEMAMMMKEAISTTGIIRTERSATKLTPQQFQMLSRSEQDITDKLIVTEKKIQSEEEEWLKE